VIATVKQFMKGLTTLAKVPEKKVNFTLPKRSENQAILITKIAEIRIIPGQTVKLLEENLREAVALFQTDTIATDRLDVKILINKDGSLSIEGQTPYDMSQLIKLLAETRNFFSMSREILNNSPGKSLRFTVPVQNGQFQTSQLQLSFDSDNLSRQATDLSIDNKEIKLRGFSSLPKISQKKQKLALPQLFAKSLRKLKTRVGSLKQF
jgi:hypothetical protein